MGTGALIWHGKDLRHYRRLLSPPLQRLLSCPGTAALGRGVASMPLAAARRMGTGQVTWTNHMMTSTASPSVLTRHRMLFELTLIRGPRH